MKYIRNKGLSRAESRGFTLIELLVVIAIIGILVAMIVLVLIDVKNKSKDASVVTSISTANNAAYTCILGGGSVNDFDTVNNGGNDLCNNDISMIWPALPSGGPFVGGWDVTEVTDSSNDNYTFSVTLFDGIFECHSTGCIIN